MAEAEKLKNLLVALALFAGCKKAEPPMVVVDAPPVTQGPADDAALPFDPLVRSGRLDNGLRYLIRRNTEPESRAVFRLAVDAGSLLEDEDQRGLAHLVEHMAFNGTEAYPGNELIRFLESTGTRFGAHLNAHTSFDETVYKLTVPTDDATYDEAWTILHEWACCVRFDDDEIEKERGVVLEEWRRRLGPGQRYWDRVAPELYRGAPHAERMPIGTEASLQGFGPDEVRRYYRDWYRPELMTLIVVGDFDVDAAEQRVQSVFSDLKGPEPARERIRFPLAMQHERAFVMAVDPEAPRSGMNLTAKRPHPQEATFADRRAGLVRRMAMAVANERLSERSLQPDAAFLRASVNASRWNPEQGGESLGIGFDDGRALDALRDVWTEIRRLAVHGALPEELDRARQGSLEFYRRIESDLDNHPSTRLADELVRHALNREPVLGLAGEVEHGRRLLATITVDDLKPVFEQMLRSDAEVFALTLASADAVLPTPEQVQAVFDEVDAATPEAPAAATTIERLVADPPPAGTIESVDRRYEALGFTGWTFANGIQVWFKDTDFKEDEIRLRGWIQGGHSSVSDEAWNDARSADAIVGWSGLGDHGVEALRRYFEDKRASLSMDIGRDRVTFSGTSSPRDLGIQLQKLWLTATAARMTEPGLASMQSRWAARIRNRDNDPGAVFSDAWTALGWPDDPRLAPTTMEQVEGVDLAGARQVWDQALQGLGRARFVFVGNLPPDFEKVVSTWVGGLPGPTDGLERKPRPARATGDLTKVVNKGVDAKALFRTEYWGELDAFGPDERFRYDATGDILAVVLRERLREELGGVYGVGVRFSWSSYPTWSYRFRIDFSCDPGRIDELEQTVRDTLAEVARDGLEPRFVQAEIAKNREQHEERVRTNGYWVSHLEGALRRGEDPLEVQSFSTRNEALSPAIVQEIVASAFDPQRRVTLKMLPEG